MEPSIRKLSEVSDQDLMADFSRGLVTAFDILYDRHYGPVYRYLVALCPEEAEDLVAECFKKLALEPYRYDPAKGPLKAWLFTIAGNLTRSYFRKVKSRLQQLGSSVDGGLFDLRTSAVPPGVTENTLAVQECWRRLDIKSRQIVYLTLLEGYAIDETAKMLNLPMGTVGTRKMRALEKLKSCLGGTPGCGGLRKQG